jgi:N6-L-threonylcarbamoyladenine synthase
VEVFVFGRRGTGYFDVRRLDGTTGHPSAKAKDLVLLERAHTLLTERRIGFSSPCVNAGVSEA